MIVLENIKENILKLIEEIEQMVKEKVDKKSIEIKRKELDKLLDLYLKDI